jgi:hypothetical protein
MKFTSHWPVACFTNSHKAKTLMTFVFPEILCIIWLFFAAFGADFGSRFDESFAASKATATFASSIAERLSRDNLLGFGWTGTFAEPSGMSAIDMSSTRQDGKPSEYLAGQVHESSVNLQTFGPMLFLAGTRAVFPNALRTRERELFGTAKANVIDVERKAFVV